jgi:hypothetical protein
MRRDPENFVGPHHQGLSIISPKFVLAAKATPFQKIADSSCCTENDNYDVEQDYFAPLVHSLGSCLCEAQQQRLWTARCEEARNQRDPYDDHARRSCTRKSPRSGWVGTRRK